MSARDEDQRFDDGGDTLEEALTRHLRKLGHLDDRELLMGYGIAIRTSRIDDHGQPVDNYAWIPSDDLDPVTAAGMLSLLWLQTADQSGVIRHVRHQQPSSLPRQPY